MLAFREEIPRLTRRQRDVDLDVLQGFATTCASSRGAVGFVRPTFSPQESKNLEISKSWHPLLKPSIVDDDKGVTHDCGIIDNDVSMATPFTLLTGPNMSGKSSLLRQIALTFIMAQCGCYVPARECDISVADAVWRASAESDNLANGISTFLSEMQGSSKIMQDLTSSTLVILDELGRGTSTLDGYAIAYAVSRELIAGAAKPRVFFATHYHELANDLARDPETGKSFIARHIGVSSLRPGSIRMKFKLETGPAPLGSCALHVARLAGFLLAFSLAPRTSRRRSISRRNPPRTATSPPLCHRNLSSPPTSTSASRRWSPTPPSSETLNPWGTVSRGVNSFTPSGSSVATSQISVANAEDAVESHARPIRRTRSRNVSSVKNAQPT